MVVQFPAPVLTFDIAQLIKLNYDPFFNLRKSNSEFQRRFESGDRQEGLDV